MACQGIKYKFKQSHKNKISSNSGYKFSRDFMNGILAMWYYPIKHNLNLNVSIRTYMQVYASICNYIQDGTKL